MMLPYAFGITIALVNAHSHLPAGVEEADITQIERDNRKRSIKDLLQNRLEIRRTQGHLAHVMQDGHFLVTVL